MFTGQQRENGQYWTQQTVDKGARYTITYYSLFDDQILTLCIDHNIIEFLVPYARDISFEELKVWQLGTIQYAM